MGRLQCNYSGQDFKKPEFVVALVPLIPMVETPTRSKYTFHNTTETELGWLSPSSIVEFLRCGQCFYLNRIRKLPKPLGVNLPIGAAVHKAVEQARLATTMRGGGLHVPDVSDDIAADWFDQEVAQPTDEETGEALDILEIDLGSKYSNLGQAKDDVVRLAKFAVPQILKLDRSRGRIAAVEYNLSMLESPWPFAVQSRLDVLYGDGKPELATIMADLKTSKNQAPPDEYTAIAQSIYKEFWLARNWPLTAFADVVSKDKHPSLQSYPLVVDDYARQLTYQTVMDVAEDISAGRFRPHPGWWCSFVHGYPEFQVAINGFAEVGE